MTHDEAENFLAHYGKKGMRWGVSNVLSTGTMSRKGFNKSANLGDAIRKNRGLNGKRNRNGGELNETVADNRQLVKVGATALLAVGAFKMSNLIKNPSVRTGAKVATALLTLGAVSKMDSDYQKMNNSFTRDREREESKN